MVLIKSVVSMAQEVSDMLWVYTDNPCQLNLNANSSPVLITAEKSASVLTNPNLLSLFDIAQNPSIKVQRQLIGHTSSFPDCCFFLQQSWAYIFATMSKGPAVGIDLGTTDSCVGEHRKVEIIANDQGNWTTPSYVTFTNTKWLISDAAKNQVTMNPTNTVFDAKQLIGWRFNDAVVQSDMKHWPFMVANDAGRPKV